MALWRHVDFSRRWLWRCKSTSGCGFSDGTRLRRSKFICIPNFDISFTAELLLLPVSENGRPPYWNSASGFDSDLFVVLGMLNCIGISNFIFKNRTIHGGVMTSYRFFKMAAMASQMYFQLSVWWWHTLRRPKSICIPNFDESSIHGWVITTSGFVKLTAAILECYFLFAIWSYKSVGL